jgi:PIN domain nuclease of toxin-antitoxin system
MKFLLDTHILIWATDGEVKAEDGFDLGDPEHELYFSAASIWEMTIKASLSRKDFKYDPENIQRGLLKAGYKELPVTSRHGTRVGWLPSIHSDPFDRLLLAQSIVEKMILVTADKELLKYPCVVVRARKA